MFFISSNILYSLGNKKRCCRAEVKEGVSLTQSCVLPKIDDPKVLRLSRGSLGAIFINIIIYTYTHKLTKRYKHMPTWTYIYIYDINNAVWYIYR